MRSPWHTCPRWRLDRVQSTLVQATMWCHKAKSIRTPIMSEPSHLRFFNLPEWRQRSSDPRYKGDFQQSAICEMLINLVNPFYWKSVAHVKQSVLHVLVSVLHSARLIRGISNYSEKSQTRICADAFGRISVGAMDIISILHEKIFWKSQPKLWSLKHTRAIGATSTFTFSLFADEVTCSCKQTQCAILCMQKEQ